MNDHDCIEFLNRHQPMPADMDWDEECRKLDAVRRHLMDNPSIESLPLILNVFGDGSGYGVYQQIELVVMKFPSSVVVPHLLTALNSGTRSIKYWNAQISANFPSEDLIKPLANLCSSGDHDLCAAAITALGQIESPEVKTYLELLLTSDDLDDDLRELVIDGLENQ